MARVLGLTCVSLAIVLVVVLGQEKYSSKYDNIKLEDIIQNDRLLKRYLECLLAPTDAKCTEDAKLLRGVVGEGLVTDCLKCTDKQKAGALKAVKYLLNNRPEMWQQIQDKYDPTGIFLSKHPELRE